MAIINRTINSLRLPFDQVVRSIDYVLQSRILCAELRDEDAVQSKAINFGVPYLPSKQNPQPALSLLRNNSLNARGRLCGELC